MNDYRAKKFISKWANKHNKTRLPTNVCHIENIDNEHKNIQLLGKDYALDLLRCGGDAVEFICRFTRTRKK
jgi:hypothetical protein